MSGMEIGVVVVVVVVWLGLVALVLRGWRNRGRRQAETIGTPPPPPDDLPTPTRGPDTGLYVGSTMAPSWQDRIAVGDLGDRAAASIAAYPEGILIERQGASEIWIPRSSITAVRTERGLAGKVMTADGVLVIRWVLPTGTEIDSGLRADDKTVYPGWVDEFAEAERASAEPAPDDAEQRKDQ
ncbi:transporter [Gordonia sp. LSe1-13]|uniref:Transporter n=2 Tax=Gordonia sesuvii TaxID=3116777 RepID=A0ABU7MBG3_9ACTN|nr:transporter [Gordonia sp. LSe1-13]